MIHHQDRRITRIISEDRAAQLLLCGARQIFPGKRPWMPPFLECYLTKNSMANWMDVAFVSGFPWSGSAATHWTDPTGTFRMWLESSIDLRIWRRGEFSDLGVYPHASGHEYRARNSTPNYWQDVMVDLHIRSDRYGKSIVALDLLETPILLPSYPYSLPDDAALLQIDLRAAGFSGATVRHDVGTVRAKISNYTPQRVYRFATQSNGTNVTGVYASGQIIPLPRYPYSIPSGASLLEQDLHDAGYPGARVSLHAGEWEISIYDIVAQGGFRPFTARVDPPDPFPVYDLFGVYTGDAPGDTVAGESRNVRTPAGAALVERPSQFARLAFRRLK